jgi:signal transduction histidine kinase
MTESKRATPLRRGPFETLVTRGVAGAVLFVGVTALVGAPLTAATLLPFAAGAVAILAAGVWAARAVERRVLHELRATTALVRRLGSEDDDGSEGKSYPPARAVEGADGLIQATERLATRFEEVAAAEQGAKNAEEKAHRARGLLFAGISHDLKSPLNALLGFADLLSMGELTPGQRESVDVIASRGRELVALIETMLDSARVEMGQLAISPRPTDLAGILRAAGEKAGQLAEGPPPQIVLEGTVPDVAADATHLTRAFALVIAHATKSGSAATPIGAARAEQPIESQGVVIRVRPWGEHVRVDVEHRGRGPTAAVLEELYFESRKGRGLRLGLRLARTILEMHGGRIEILERTNGRPLVACFVPTAREGA